MYYGHVQPLPQIVLAYIRKHKLLMPGDRVGIAVSGGTDSVALLRLLMDLRKELGIVLSVVHFNHQLRGAESEADQRFVADLARQHGLQLHCASGNVAEYAAKQKLSLESAARELRYRYFRGLLREQNLNRIATAHTLDDQAETLLLRLVRGAGTRGLAGIYPQLSVAGSQLSETERPRGPAIVRPLLSVRRADLEAYLNAIYQPWREDSSNRDLRHARNRVRHETLPALEQSLNPAVREVLAETAEIARAEEEYWQKEIQRLLISAWRPGAGTGDEAPECGALRTRELAGLPLAVQRRLVRAAAETLGLHLEFRHVEEILGLASTQPGSPKSTVLPDGWAVSRRRGELRFSREIPSPSSSDYEFPLPIPGKVEIPQLGSRFEALLVSGNAAEVYNREHLLDRARLSPELTVRNWHPGDRFWPPHTKAPKKIKELLQQLHVGAPQRKLWPVVASAGDVIWVRGFPVRNQFQPQHRTAQAVLIRETSCDTVP